MSSTDASSSTAQPPMPIKQTYMQLHMHCHDIINESFDKEEISRKISECHAFIDELISWQSILQDKTECQLLTIAVKELQFSMLSLVEGHYRNAFKGLRLVLELSLQMIHLSVNILDLHDWLEGKQHTNWSLLVGESGVFQARFARCFLPDLEDDLPFYQNLARAVYTECSEAVHGNIPKESPFPDELLFSTQTICRFHDKCKVVGTIIHILLTMRYLQTISKSVHLKLETILMDRLGHMPSIRAHFSHGGGA